MGKGGVYDKGTVWNGLTAINENPTGGEANPFYANNKKYLNIIATEDFGFGIEAYTYPDEWEACDGSVEIAPGVTAGQQTRKVFGLTYRTLIGMTPTARITATRSIWSMALRPPPLSVTMARSTRAPSPPP